MDGVHTLDVSDIKGTKTTSTVEYSLDYFTIGVCEKIVNTHPVVKMCLQAIFNNLFKYGIEIRKGKKRVRIKKNIQDFLNKTCVQFCREFIKCFYAIGIVPISLTIDKNNNPIPIVMNELGFISVVTQSGVHQGKKFQFYKYGARKTATSASHAKVDKKTMIMSGYACDPTMYGEICSNIATCRSKVIFTEKQFSCAYHVANAQCKPSIITEIVDPEMYRTGKAMGTNLDINMWYGNRNRHETGEHDKIMYNEQEVRAMEQYNRMFLNSWNNTMNQEMIMRGDGASERPPPMPITNLPVGHKIANNVPMPQSRDDLLQVDEREEEIICSVLGVPKILFSGDSRIGSGVKASSEMFIDTLSEWRSKLSSVLTTIFKCIYVDEICEMYAGDLMKHIKNKKNVTEQDMYTKLSEIMSQEDITVHFPYLPYESSEQIWDDFLKGIIDYPDMVIYSKMLQNIPISDEDLDAKPPWEGLKGIEMLLAETKGQQQELLKGKLESGSKVKGEKKAKKEDKEEVKKEKSKKRKEPEVTKKKIIKKKSRRDSDSESE